jgi:AcrR family transcriptional regulator
MDERIRFLRSLEPKNAGRGSYLAILEAAAGLFRQFPADAITLRDILALSGVSNQTLYNYFPAGRDDVAIALFDRLRRADEQAFRSHLRTLPWGSLTEADAITQALAASLARATLGNLKENFQLQSAVSAYLKAHQLRTKPVHAEDLDRALQEEILTRYGNRFPGHAAAPAAQLSLHVVRGVIEVAMAHPASPLGDLESMTRKLLRPILQAGLMGGGPVSGTHPISADAPPPVAIAGAPVSSSRRQAILARIFRRGQPR